MTGRGLRGLQHDKVIPVERLYTLGQEFGRRNEGLIESIVEKGGPDDLGGSHLHVGHYRNAQGFDDSAALPDVSDLDFAGR